MSGVEQQPVELSTRRVLEAISRHLGVPVVALKGRNRTAPVVAARWVAVVLLRERCRLSYRQLGLALRRDGAQVYRTHRYVTKLQGMLEVAEYVDRMMHEEAPRTARAVVDIEEEFRRAREDAGAPAKSTDKRPI